MKLICHIRDESRELLPSMAPRSEAMKRLWKEPNRGMQQVNKHVVYFSLDISYMFRRIV